MGTKTTDFMDVKPSKMIALETWTVTTEWLTRLFEVHSGCSYGCFFYPIALVKTISLNCKDLGNQLHYCFFP